MSTYLFGGKNYSLKNTITSTATSIILSSFKEPVSGADVTMSLMNSTIAYGTIAPKTGKSEFISFTGITQNADGTATLTGVTRGLKRGYDYSSSATFKLPHNAGTKFILSDSPEALNAILGTTTLTVGTTPITSGTTTRVLYDNAGVVGEYVVSGTGSVVMTNSPTLVTPALGTPTALVLTNATGLPISTGMTGLGTGVATALAVNLGSAGSFVTFNGALGTPSSATLTNATGLPISTGVSGLGTGVATFLATPTSANLASAITNETGSGSLVFGTSPTLTTPIIVTSINDSSSNELIKFTSTGSAVNEITITNAATGNAPSIISTGDDNNIGLIIDTKTGPSTTGVLSLRSGGYKILESSPLIDTSVGYESYVTIYPGNDSGTGSPDPTTIAVGSSVTNVDLHIAAKGTGTVIMDMGMTSKSATNGIGYSTGSGGTQTQGTSRTTAVTLNKLNGAITLVSAAGSTTPATFTVNNTTVAATDTIIVNQKSGTDLYTLSVTRVAANAFDITFNTKSGTTTEQPVFNFAVIKAVTS